MNLRHQARQLRVRVEALAQRSKVSPGWNLSALEYPELARLRALAIKGRGGLLALDVASASAQDLVRAAQAGVPPPRPFDARRLNDAERDMLDQLRARAGGRTL